MPIAAPYTIGPQDLGRTLPNITLGAANDLATITATVLGVTRAVQHTCAAAWEYSSDNVNWYAMPALTPLVISPMSLPGGVYYARSTAGGRLDMLVVK